MCCLPYTQKPMSENKPYRIYIPEEVIDKLNAIARKTGFDTGNKVASDVVMTCLDIWIEARRSFDDRLVDFLEEIRAEAASARADRRKRG